MNELVTVMVVSYKETKARHEKWLANNEDLNGATEYQMMLLRVALLDFGIAFWSSFLETQNAG